ncbi:MAG: hypothetical protein PHP01_06800 [Phycisphaerae bacterium]|nr:hypothetical protein [Phycisphaerae bacterium]
MEQNKYLGIYIASDKATVVLAGKSGSKIEIAQQFSIAVPAAQPFSFTQTAADIASVCQEKQVVFEDIAVVLDCRLYRQQLLHSEFTEYRQIAQTIKFDAEEALAVNAADTAIAFEPASKGLSGTEVSVFAAETSILSGIITAMAANKLDPVSIEPDSICLRRIMGYIADKENLKAMWMVISEKKCFIVSPPPAGGKAQIRAFVTAASQNKTSLVAREIMLTTASAVGNKDIQKVFLCDLTGKVDIAALNRESSVQVEPFGIEQIIASPAEPSSDVDDLDVIVAAGASAGLLTKCEKINFRSDFMPYQGRKEILEKALKMLSFCLLLLFVTIGVYLHMQYYKTSSYRNKLNEKFKAEYSIAMPGAKFINSRDAAGKLKREINKIKDVKSGLLSAAGDDSVEAKLTFLFEAVNSVPKSVDIDIDKIAVTTKTMTITGSTSNGGHLQLFGAVDKHPKLARANSTYEGKDNRDYFRLTIDLK